MFILGLIIGACVGFLGTAMLAVGKGGDVS